MTKMSDFRDRTPETLPSLINEAQKTPRLSYYITRTDGTLVPLVPADELPSNLLLHGPPRSLNSDQIFGLQYVSTLPSTGLTFRLEQDPSDHRRASSQHSGIADTYFDIKRDRTSTHPTRHFTSSSLSPNGAGAGGDISRSEYKRAESWCAQPPSNPQALIDAIVGTRSGAQAATQIGYQIKSSNISPAITVGPSRDKKEYCTHWIRTGECDYLQQGCLYKHEMPDKATLQKVGFRTTPRWWLENNQMIRLGSKKTTDEAFAATPAWRKSAGEQDTRSDNSEVEASDERSSSTDSLQVEFTPYQRRAKDAVLPWTASYNSTVSPVNVQGKERKNSVMSDLIDFEPLLAKPQHPIGSSNAIGAKDRSDGRFRQIEPNMNHGSPSKDTSECLPSKIFVPRGESPDAHVTEVKKIAVQSRKERHATKARVNFPASSTTNPQIQGRKHVCEHDRSTHGHSSTRELSSDAK